MDGKTEGWIILKQISSHFFNSVKYSGSTWPLLLIGLDKKIFTLLIIFSIGFGCSKEPSH